MAKPKSTKATDKARAAARVQPAQHDKRGRISWLTILVIVFVVAVVGLGIFLAVTPDTSGGASASPTITATDTTPGGGTTISSSDTPAATPTS